MKRQKPPENDSFGPEEFAAATGAPRETVDRLIIYADLLRKWNQRINIVSPASIDSMWRRHFLDSAQLLKIAEKVLANRADGRSYCWADFGSGGGFPALVLAIMVGNGPDRGRPPTPGGSQDNVSRETFGQNIEPGSFDFHLVESDARKVAFLREAARLTDTNVTIHNCRIENLEPFPVDLTSARALAPLPKMLDLLSGFIGKETTCLFPKGQDVDIELTNAAKCWNMEVHKVQSLTDEAGTILMLRNVIRR